MILHLLAVGLAFLAPIAPPDTPPLQDAARTMAGVTMPGTADVAGQKLVLNGVALRKKAVFKVYVAGLYLPAPNKDAAAILAADTPRRVVLHFVRDVGASSMCEAWDEGLKNNTPNPSAELQGQFKTLCTWMEEMKDDGQLVFSYVPGQGTTVDAMGKTKGTVPGKEFADAMFRCWIGPKPGPGEDFKKGLLGAK